MKRYRNDQRINHQGHQQHGTDQHCHQLSIGSKYVQAVAGYGPEHQAADTEGRQVNHPAHSLGHGIGHICQKRLGPLAGTSLQGKPQNRRPEQDSHIVGIRNGIYRVIDDIHQQSSQHLLQSAGGCLFSHILCKNERLRKQEARSNRHCCRKKCRKQVIEDNKAEPPVQLSLSLAQRTHDQDGDQDGRDGFQGADKHVAEDADPFCLRNHQCQDNTDDNARSNTADQADAVIACGNLFQCVHDTFSGFCFLHSVCNCDTLKTAQTNAILLSGEVKIKENYIFCIR